MEAPFEALDMFPDSMHRLLSYENMLTGALTGPSEEEGDAMLEHNGVDTLDTCGFPLFSHDLQNEPRKAEHINQEILLADPISEEDQVNTKGNLYFVAAVHFSDRLVRNELRVVQAALTMAKRSRFINDAESMPGFEALVLEELEDVVFQVCSLAFMAHLHISLLFFFP